MFIESISMKNFLCFRGTHHVQLGPGAWAIVAHGEDDKDRSNGFGKTAIFRAIRFALYGEHDAPTENAWITRDESDGSVTLILSNGWTVTRTRVRDKSTQLVVTTPEMTKAKGDEGQAALERMLGFDDDDFIASVFLRQKHHSQFIIARPADRQEILSGWLRLEKVQAAEDYASKQYAEATMRAERARARVETQEQRVRFLLESAPNELRNASDVFAAVKEFRKQLALDLDNLKMLLEDEENTWKAHREKQLAYESSRRDQKEFDDLVQIGTGVAASVKQLESTYSMQREDELRSAIAIKRGEIESITSELKRAKEVAAGSFNGICPVIKEPCPAKEEVCSRTAAHQKVLITLRADLDAAQKEHDTLATEHKTLLDIGALLMKQRARLTSLRSQAKAVKAKLLQVEDPGQFNTSTLHELRTAVPRTESRIESIDQALAVGDQQIQEASKESREAADLAEKWKRTANVLGRAIAQRAIAERGLHQIEANANAMLAAAQVPLTVHTTWQRPAATGLADVCAKCGLSFTDASSRKCLCGADRGPKQVQKLEVELSDQSGALEDIAGLAYQMSAAEWLRDQRHAAWSVLMLDEPFAALDRSLRQSLSAHLLGMLQHGHWEQAFIVSHDPAAQAMMPQRIVITAHANGSSIEVQS